MLTLVSSLTHWLHELCPPPIYWKKCDFRRDFCVTIQRRFTSTPPLPLHRSPSSGMDVETGTHAGCTHDLPKPHPTAGRPARCSLWDCGASCTLWGKRTSAPSTCYVRSPPAAGSSGGGFLPTETGRSRPGEPQADRASGTCHQASSGPPETECRPSAAP